MLFLEKQARGFKEIKIYPSSCSWVSLGLLMPLLFLIFGVVVEVVMLGTESRTFARSCIAAPFYKYF